MLVCPLARHFVHLPVRNVFFLKWFRMTPWKVQFMFRSVTSFVSYATHPMSFRVFSYVTWCVMSVFTIQSCIIFIVQLHSVSVTSSCHKVSYCVIYLICHVIHLVKLHSGFPIIWCSDLSRHRLVASTGPSSSFWPWKLPLFSPPFWAASLKGTWRFIVTFWSTHFQETPFFQLSFPIPLIAPKPS